MKSILFSFLLALVWGVPSIVAQTAPTSQGSLPGASRDARYRLQPSDQLQIEYRYSPEFNESLTIEPDGFVNLSLIGDVKLEGLTLDEARSLLLAKLQTRLNDPEIKLTLQDFVKPTYVVAGHVAAPGRFELRGNITAVEAIAIAGGFKSDAMHSQVILFRHLQGDMAETHLLDIKKITDPAHPHLEESLNLRPGDLLIVPQNRISKLAPYLHWISIGTFFPL